MKKFFNLLKKIWCKIYNPIGFIASIITIILLFINTNTVFRYILCAIILLYLVFLIWYVVRSIFNTNKAKAKLETEYLYRNKKIAESLHRYYHNLRNIISQVDVSKIVSYDDIEDKCKNLCDYLTEFYNTLFQDYLDKYSVSVCIKLIKAENIIDEDYKNWFMKTIARSASTEQSRTKIDKNLIEVSKNSVFEVILSENYKDDLFSFSDMRNIAEDFLKTYKIQYTNSRGENFLDHYKSTIIVPIKIDGKDASKSLKNLLHDLENRSLYLGFLCVDSLKVFETEKEKMIFAAGVEYTKNFGDSLYLLFEKILPSCIKDDTLKKGSDNFNTKRHVNRTSKRKNTYNTTSKRNRRQK